jgi:hypothetical protein
MIFLVLLPNAGMNLLQCREDQQQLLKNLQEILE